MINPLQSRLASLRRRLRTVTLMRGVGSLATLVLGFALLAGALDWGVNLPSLVRALLLCGLLTAAGYVGYCYLIHPWREKTDDLSLALKVEERYPELNDALASTVQFLQEADADKGDSPALRREAVERALRQAQNCDFDAVVDRRGTRWLALSTGSLGVLTFFLC